MADNYLEKRYDEYQARREAERKARNRAWKKRLDAYRRQLAGQTGSVSGSAPSSASMTADAEQ